MRFSYTSQDEPIILYKFLLTLVLDTVYNIWGAKIYFKLAEWLKNKSKNNELWYLTANNELW